MMNFKKLLVAISAASLAALGIGNMISSAAEEKTVLNFYYWDEGQKEGMDALIDGFEATHENITVESTIIPWSDYWVKLQTSLPSGTGPDIMWTNCWASPYVDAGLLYDMTEKVESDGVDMSKYPDAVLATSVYDGHVYGIPKDYDGYAIYYNKAIFDEMGVAYPEEGWTWDDFRDTAIALTNDDHYGFAAHTDNVCYRTLIISNGGSFISDDGLTVHYNEPANVETLQFLHDLIYVDGASPTAADFVEIGASDMFMNGMVAMMPNGSWSLSTYAEALGDDLGIISFPQKVKKGSVTSGLSYSMAANGSHIEEAWEFCKFAASKEGQDLTVSAAIPANEDSKEAWLEHNAAYPDAHYLVDDVATAVSNPIYGNNKTNECESIEVDAITKAWMDPDADIQAIMDQCVADMTAVLHE